MNHSSQYTDKPESPTTSPASVAGVAGTGILSNKDS